MAKPIPEGFHTMTPYLCIKDAAKAIDFYKRAFGAQEIMRMTAPGGKIGHAELKIGDSILMISDEFDFGAVRSPQTLGGTASSVFMYVDDVDKVYNQAVSAGAKSTAPLKDEFWGDRFGSVTDPFGHVWSLATHKEDVAPEEMKRRSVEAMAKMSQRTQGA